MLQAETLAQSAERGGKKVAQIEWAGGRSGTIDGPTLDFRNFRSGRGVATNYIAPTRLGGLHPVVRPAVRPSGRLRRQRAVPAGRAVARDRLDDVPHSFSPAQEMRMRVLDFGVDKYGLNAYIYDSRNDGRTRYDRVLFSTTKDGDDSVGDLREGEWADVKVTIQGSDLDGKTGGMLVKVERLAGDLSQVRLFHTSVTRAIASWPSWPGEPGFTGTFEDFVAEEFPSSQAADFAVLEAGIVSEETYVEQGLYWSDGLPPADQVRARHVQAGPRARRLPVTDEFQHQFLGLVTKRLPNGAPNPAYDDVEVNGTPDGRVKEREAFIREAYEEADATMRLAQKHMRDRDLTTFVVVRPRLRAAVRGDRREQGARRPRSAVAAADRRTAARRPARRSARPRPASPAARCRSTSTWPGAIRRAAAFQQVPAAEEAATVAQIKAAFLALEDPNDWTGDGNPEGWKVIDRAFTKAEARHIPNGGRGGADMAHPTRTGDLVVFSTPPYQFDAATPGTLIARSAFFGQHGYVPDVQDLKSNTNMRATFLAGGKAIERGGRQERAQHRPRADGGVPARRPGARPQPGRRAPRPARQGPQVQAAVDHRAERLPRAARPDDAS